MGMVFIPPMSKGIDMAQALETFLEPKRACVFKRRGGDSWSEPGEG